MALCDFRVSHKSQTTYAKSASMQAQYITREGYYSPTTEQSNYITRAQRYTMGKEDLVARGGQLPAWAQDDYTAFWDAADKYERSNGRICESWIVSLPRELSHEQNIALVKDLLATTVQDRHPHTWAMHEVTAKDGLPQPHLHVMFSGRTFDGIDRTPAQFFQRYNARHPEAGGAQKAPDLWQRQHVQSSRQLYSDVANMHLEQAGLAVRLDPRNRHVRGLGERPTEIHLGPRPRQDLVEQNASIRAARAQDATTEQHYAQQYWEARKQVLGLTPGMDQAEIIRRIGDASRGRLTPPQETTTRTQRQGEQADQHVIGNKRSMIYHLPGSPNYGDVHPNNQEHFRTTRAAEAAGYRLAKNVDDGGGALEALTHERLAELRTLRQAEAHYVQHPDQLRTPAHLAAIAKVLREDDGHTLGRSRMRPRWERDGDDQGRSRSHGRRY